MADSILRLKVDSQEYDNKLKRAAEGIKRYADNCRAAGGTLEHLDDGVLDFVKSLGQMDTVASNTKSQLREMTQTLTDLTQVYRGLTDEEKSSPFGQELSKGIQTLTERAGQAKDAMADVAASIQHASSDTRAFDQISQGIGIMTSGFQTVTGAAKLFGIQIGDNVEVIAKLQAAMAVTNGLTQAQTALQKQSALMQGVMAVQAKAAALAISLQGANTKAATVAQAAFNAVAKANPYVLLASAVAAVGAAMIGFSKDTKKAIEATKVETDAMKEASRMADIWKNTMSTTFSSLMTTYDDLKMKWQALKDEHQKIEWIKKNQSALKQLGGAVTDVKTAEDFFNNNTDAVVQSFVRRAQAAARVAQLTELYRKQIELLDKKSQASAAIASDAENQGRSAKAGEEIKDSTYRNSRYGKVNAQGKWVFTEQGAKLYSGTDTSSSRTVMQIDAQINANQSEIDKVKREITNEFNDITITPHINTGGGGGGGGDDEDSIAEKIARGWDKAVNKSALSADSMKAIMPDMSGPSAAWKAFVDSINNGSEQATNSLQSLTEAFEALNKAEGVTPTEKLGKDADKSAKSFQSAASAIGQVGSALNSIEDPTAKIMGIVAQAVASVALGFSQATTAEAGKGVYAWIAAIAGGMATMYSTIESIHSATGYAEGGIIKGNSYSGDKIGGVVDGSQFIGLNAGELVLNASQQSMLASNLQNGGGGKMEIVGVLSGENVVLMADRWGRRTGRGELLFGKNL